uniref:Uncharacterized protein n=1 Tax=Chlamydomonas leiostraca TaxID=1034604 RepID=A0A6T8QWI5_9CHLO|eukprot:CAMPEP_0202862790 /NCGR_PEP_ID=MMETSP1391-20130828/3701_1 /ASSEMBLY_ACC=CAM_ASM_000867 /TAXON_ID=1034604 /ORGANISM="Chlamydomonas leiostraca, Strain SAG 11-49" /LENGTH=134 /DNA_ID=CAMNT_0049542367 /DNA_START=146 /DNA_END=550 /DNA_ORIENTATION=+
MTTLAVAIPKPAAHSVEQQPKLPARRGLLLQISSRARNVACRYVACQHTTAPASCQLQRHLASCAQDCSCVTHSQLLLKQLGYTGAGKPLPGWPTATATTAPASTPTPAWPCCLGWPCGPLLGLVHVHEERVQV